MSGQCDFFQLINQVNGVVYFPYTFTSASVFIIWILTLQAASWEVWRPCVENDVNCLLQDLAIHCLSRKAATGSYPERKASSPHPLVPNLVYYIANSTRLNIFYPFNPRHFRLHATTGVIIV